jgi:predicted secreted hydrolase
MRQRTVFLALVMLLVLLVPTLLGCSEKASHGPAQVHFPEDEGAHPGSKVEWWYLNATVSDNAGHQYNAMLVYFDPSLKISSIADLDDEVFYHEVPTISELVAAKPDYAEGKLDLK